MSSATTAGVVVTASVAAIAGAGYLAYRWGLWQPVEVAETTVGPVVCIYKDYVGPYHNVGNAITAVRCAVVEHRPFSEGGGRLRNFGCYYDKPRDVPPEKCRASVGVMLWGGAQDGMSEADLKKQADTINQEPWVKDNLLKAVVLPASRYAFCDLPFYGQLSLIIGIWRAYSKLEVVCAVAGENGAKVYGSLEMYDADECRMHIGFPLNVRDVLLPFQHDK